MADSPQEAEVWSPRLVARCGGLSRTQAAPEGQEASAGRNLYQEVASGHTQDVHRPVTATPAIECLVLSGGEES